MGCGAVEPSASTILRIFRSEYSSLLTKFLSTSRGAGPVVFLIPEIELDGLRLGGVVGSGTLSGRGFLYLIVVGIAIFVRGGKAGDGLGEAAVLGEGEGRRSRLRQVELLVLDIAVFHLALIEGEGEGRGRVREVGVFIVELLGDGHGAVLHLDIRNGMGFDRRICAVVGIDGDRTCVALVIAIGRSDLGDGIRRSIFLGMDRQGQSAVGVDGFILILMAVAVIKGERRAAERGGSVVLEFLQTDDADAGNGVDELSRHRLVETTLTSTGVLIAVFVPSGDFS